MDCISTFAAHKLALMLAEENADLRSIGLKAQSTISRLIGNWPTTFRRARFLHPPTRC
jgi:hypothetical protein